MGIEGLGSWDVSLMRILENLISGKMKSEPKQMFFKTGTETGAMVD